MNEVMKFKYRILNEVKWKYVKDENGNHLFFDTIVGAEKYAKET